MDKIDIEELIKEYGDAVNEYSLNASIGEALSFLAKAAQTHDALLSEYRRMESDLATLLPVKEQLEKVDYTIEQEGEEIVVECVHCGFPIDEGHADDCPNNLGFQLASERKAHRWHWPTDEPEEGHDIIWSTIDRQEYWTYKPDTLPAAPPEGGRPESGKVE
jgi:hypothetical protein